MIAGIQFRLLLIYPVRTQKLQVRDDVVDVVVGQHDDPQGPRANRVLCLVKLKNL